MSTRFDYLTTSYFNPIMPAKPPIMPKAMPVYRMAGNFRGVLIFAIFVVDLAVTKFSTHENKYPR